MVIKDFFEPIPNIVHDSIETLSSNQIGKSIDFHLTTFPDLSSTKIALIGLNNNFDSVRYHFFSMNQHFKNLQIADLGNLKANYLVKIDELLKYLLSNKILPILIGGDTQSTYSLHKAYDRLTNTVIIDERIPFVMDNPRNSNSLLNQIFENNNENLFNLGVVGYQTHYVDKRILEYFDKNHYEHLRLGQVRNNIEEAEPIIRDADMIVMNLSVLKKAEVPACDTASPSGIFTEDACQLAYYAGISDKLSSFGLFGFDLEKDSNHQTAQVISQIIWYFLYGYYNRKHDYPITKGNLTEYVVSFKKHSYQITFWKSNQSDRWWMEVPTKTKQQQRHRLIPCSYQDYLQACREDLPERLLAAYRRFA